MRQIGKGLGEVRQKAGDLIEPWRMQVQPAALRLSERSDQMTPSLGLVSADLGLVSNFLRRRGEAPGREDCAGRRYGLLASR